MNNQSPTVFQFHTHSVRIFPTADGLSFVAVANDVARVLGYLEAKDFLRQVPEHHKGRQKVPTLQGDQEMLVVAEAGLYRGVLRSNKPEAEPFMEWVTAEVLPSIRRTGGYVKPAARLQQRGKVRITRAVERQVLELFVDGYAQKEIARAAGVSVSTVSLLIHAKYRFAPSLGRSECPPDLISAVTARHMEIEAERLAAQKDRIAQKFLTNSHNQELAESLEYVGQCALDGSLALLTDD